MARGAARGEGPDPLEDTLTTTEYINAARERLRGYGATLAKVGVAPSHPANTLAPKLEAADEADDGPNGFTNQLALLCDSVFSGRGYAACLLSNEFGSKATLRLAEPQHFPDCGIPMGHAVLLHTLIFSNSTDDPADAKPNTPKAAKTESKADKSDQNHTSAAKSPSDDHATAELKMDILRCSSRTIQQHTR